MNDQLSATDRTIIQDALKSIRVGSKIGVWLTDGTHVLLKKRKKTSPHYKKRQAKRAAVREEAFAKDFFAGQ